MRALEILILLNLFLILISFFISQAKRPRWMTFIPSLNVLLLLLHLLLEGYRLPMIPTYGLTILFFFTTIRIIFYRSKMPQDTTSRRSRIINTFGIILSWLFFPIAGVLPAVLPVFEAPVIMFILPGRKESTLFSRLNPYSTISRIWKLMVLFPRET